MQNKYFMKIFIVEFLLRKAAQSSHPEVTVSRNFEKLKGLHASTFLIKLESKRAILLERNMSHISYSVK